MRSPPSWSPACRGSTGSSLRGRRGRVGHRGSLPRARLWRLYPIRPAGRPTSRTGPAGMAKNGYSRGGPIAPGRWPWRSATTPTRSPVARRHIGARWATNSTGSSTSTSATPTAVPSRSVTMAVCRCGSSPRNVPTRPTRWMLRWPAAVLGSSDRCHRGGGHGGPGAGVRITWRGRAVGADDPVRGRLTKRPDGGTLVAYRRVRPSPRTSDGRPERRVGSPSSPTLSTIP